jgi:predicted AAA+ superfamily ATPase
MEHSHEKKREIIRDIYKRHLEKDVTNGLSVRRTDAYKQVNTILANNIQHPITYKYIALEAGITFPTLKQYIQIGEATYITNSLSPLSSGDNTNEITKSPILYFADTGLRNYLIHTF